MSKGSLDSSSEKPSALEVITDAASDVDPALRSILKERAKGPAAEMYAMSEYFLGFKDENLSATKTSLGKRFRPALALYLGDGYRARKENMSAALAIELFHNFTLIHDDIVDKDETRRGRPTVWQRFGTDHAINSGDALSLLASELCIRAEREGGPGMAEALLKAFSTVCEGQYLDFELAKRPLQEITEKNYLEMIQRKTGALVGISAESAAIAAGKNKTERENLRIFGEALGMAYQIADDYRSVWGDVSKTGKDALGDIRERKRALPVIMAYPLLPGGTQERIAGLYNLERSLTEEEVQQVKNLLDVADIRKNVLQRISRYAERAKKAADALVLPAKTRRTLDSVVDELTSMAG